MTCPDCAPTLEENRRLSRENADLRRRLAAYENPHTPPSRRIHSARARAPGARRYPGRPRGHRGATRRRRRPDLVKMPEPRERCEGCGASLGDPSFVGHRRVEEIGNPTPRQVVEYLSYEYECGECGLRSTARHPDCPPSGWLGRNAIVQATLMRYAERLPARKVSEALERTYGLRVTPATVLEAASRVARWLRPEYDAVLRRIRQSDAVYVDETSLSVDGARHWIWAFTTPRETLFAIRGSRGKRVLRTVLGDGYEGVVVCDGWRSYSNFTDRIQRCWAHLLREAEGLAEGVEEAKLSEALHRLYGGLSRWAVDKPPPEAAEGLAADARAEMLRLARGPYESAQVREFAAKILNGMDRWFTFLEAKGVEPTNNRAERALRELVVQRKIMGCLRNEKGTTTCETVMTALSTWRQQGRDLADAMGEALTREWMRS